MTPTPIPSSVPPPAPTAQNSRIEWLKEGISAVIGLAVTATTIYMLLNAFHGATAAQPDAFQRQKDLLMLVIGLFGAVSGYYLGRIPGELQAARSANQVAAAQGAVTQSAAELSELRSRAAAARADVGSAREALAASVAGATETVVSHQSRAATALDSAQRNLTW